MKNQLTFHSSKYRADIDGLRALAIISVVGFHAFPHRLSGGFIGVDIFFVLSGFLISTILFEHLEQNTFRFSDFYARRIRRIFPALLTVLISCLLFGWFALFTKEYQQLGKHIAGGASFISNFLLWQEAGYFDVSADYKPLLHLWSLGLEEQFYIIWPLLLYFFWKKPIHMGFIIIFMIAVSFGLNLKTIHKDAIATFYSPQTRFWELLCGSLLAWFTLFRKPERTPKQWFIHGLALLGFALIIYSHVKIKKHLDFPGIWALWPTLGTTLLIAAGPKAWINRTILAHRWMVGIGLISFPLYLWHWPILSFIKIMEPLPSPLVRTTAILLAVILAWLTYRFIEIPFRFYSFFPRKKIAVLCFSMLIVGGLGGWIYQQADAIFKNDPVDKAAVLIADPLPVVKDFECGDVIPELKPFYFDGGCKLSKNKLPEILFIGDSHTAHYRHAVWQQFPNQSVLMMVQTSCLPFASHHLLKGECQTKYEAIRAFLEKNTSIKTVYLSGYWSYLMTGGFAVIGENWRRAKPLDKSGAKSFKENGQKLIATLLKGKKDVVFLQDIPDLNFNVNTCFNTRPLRLPFHTVRKQCWIPLAEYQNRIAPYEQVIHELLQDFPTVKLFDPRPLFCNHDKCYARDAELPYYYSGDHLNHYGAHLVIEHMRTNTIA